jgi:hypothetical protein
MPTSVDKNEVNMGFMPLAYPLLVLVVRRIRSVILMIPVVTRATSKLVFDVDNMLF